MSQSLLATSETFVSMIIMDGWDFEVRFGVAEIQAILYSPTLAIINKKGPIGRSGRNEMSFAAKE